MNNAPFIYPFFIVSFIVFKLPCHNYTKHDNGTNPYIVLIDTHYVSVYNNNRQNYDILEESYSL